MRLNSLRSLLYAVSKNQLIHQMDVVTAFLNGSLEEEVFMERPPGYVKKGQEDLVYYLQRSLYGLNSPRDEGIEVCSAQSRLLYFQTK